MQTNKLSDDQDAIAPAASSPTDDEMPEEAEDTLSSSDPDSFPHTIDDNNDNGEDDDKFSYDEDGNDDVNIALPSESDKSISKIIEENGEAAPPPPLSNNFGQRRSSSALTSPSETSFGSITLVERWDDDNTETAAADTKIDGRRHQPIAEIYGTEIDHEQRGNFDGATKKMRRRISHASITYIYYTMSVILTLCFVSFSLDSKQLQRRGCSVDPRKFHDG